MADYDAEEIRRVREDGWFRQNEAAMLEAARRKRANSREAIQSSELEARVKAHWKKCPKCGADMQTESISGVEVEKCPDCGGIFFDRGELETVILRHDRDRRGFFRGLLGFSKD